MFGDSVRGWRNHLGISQEELAERANLHRTYISDVERGARNVSLESIEKLAHALDVSVSTLFPLLNGHAGAAGVNGRGRNLVEVLLVEDDLKDVELTLSAFKKARFTNRVHVVNDGAEALDYIFCRGSYVHRTSEKHPHIILLDLNLPKVNGLEVLRRVKAEKTTRMIPVVILTASQNSRDVAECERLGAEAYLAKPVNFQSLIKVTLQLNLNWALFKPVEADRRNVQT